MASAGKKTTATNAKAVLLVGALYSDEEYYAKAKNELAGKFGQVLCETEPRPWRYTDYYEKELGREIMRRFIFFEDPIEQESLAGIKIFMVKLEEKLSADGKRTINLDPGYLTQAKLVLASTKDYSHRIYLGQGVFAEVTLAYVKDGFKPFPYTYRDYRDDFYIGLFNKVRERAKIILGQ